MFFYYQMRFNAPLVGGLGAYLMPGRGKLSPAAVHKIFKSTDTAKVLGARHGVSQQMVYLIKSGRVHKKLTSGLTAPPRTRGRRTARKPDVRSDINALADALLKRIIARLKRR
jgi:hypothetical protein